LSIEISGRSYYDYVKETDIGNIILEFLEAYHEKKLPISECFADNKEDVTMYEYFSEESAAVV
jgi:hypothetical protein